MKKVIAALLIATVCGTSAMAQDATTQVVKDAKGIIANDLANKKSNVTKQDKNGKYKNNPKDVFKGYAGKDNLPDVKKAENAKVEFSASDNIEINVSQPLKFPNKKNKANIPATGASQAEMLITVETVKSERKAIESKYNAMIDEVKSSDLGKKERKEKIKQLESEKKKALSNIPKKQMVSVTETYRYVIDGEYDFNVNGEKKEVDNPKYKEVEKKYEGLMKGVNKKNLSKNEEKSQKNKLKEQKNTELARTPEKTTTPPNWTVKQKKQTGTITWVPYFGHEAKDAAKALIVAYYAGLSNKSVSPALFCEGATLIDEVDGTSVITPAQIHPADIYGAIEGLQIGEGEPVGDNYQVVATRKVYTAPETYNKGAVTFTIIPDAKSLAGFKIASSTGNLTFGAPSRDLAGEAKSAVKKFYSNLNDYINGFDQQAAEAVEAAFVGNDATIEVSSLHSRKNKKYNVSDYLKHLKGTAKGANMSLDNAPAVAPVIENDEIICTVEQVFASPRYKDLTIKQIVLTPDCLIKSMSVEETKKLAE